MNRHFIPGTSSVAHLRENVAAALTLSEEDLAELNGIGARADVRTPGKAERSTSRPAPRQ